MAAIVQSGYAVDDTGTTATTLPVTLAGVVAGNALLVMLGYVDVTAATMTMDDPTSYTSTDAKRGPNIDNGSSQVFRLENAGSGSHTITGRFSAAVGFRRIRAAEISGLPAASIVDQTFGQFQNTPGTGANAVSSGNSSATTNANDFVVGFTMNTTENDPGSATLAAGTGYALSGANLIVGLESKSVSATGVQAATFTQGGVNASRTAHVIALITAALGGGARPPISQITLNPGGVPMGLTGAAFGQPPTYGAVRWQNWEAYPWGPTSSAIITQIFGADVVGVIEAALLTGDGKLTAADIVASIEGANLRGDGALTGADVVGAFEGANLTAIGVLTGADVVAAIEGGLLVGTGSLAAGDVVGVVDGGLLVGSGSLSGADVVGAIEGAFLDIFVVLSQITGADVVGVIEAGNLTGLGSLVGADVVGAVETAALIATGSLSAADVVAAIERANLTSLASGTRKLRVIGSVIIRRLH